MSITFDILDWQAWFPAQHDAQPDVSVIPAMLRRRLSPLARAAMSVIMPLAQIHGPMPLVYVSRHGDLNRTVDLLRDLANGELLSPTAFSLSVHNATAGLFSIQQGLTKNITAISGGACDLVPALLESRGLCDGISESKVLCVFCDEPPPALYAAQASEPRVPYAFAMVMGVGKTWTLAAAGPVDQGVHQGEPQVWQLFDLLEQGAAEALFACNGTAWKLSLCQ